MVRNTAIQQRGFTLIELMIVAVLIGLAGLWAGPNIRQMQANMALKQQATEFIEMIQFARTEASRIDNTVNIETQHAAENDNYSAEVRVCQAATRTTRCDDENRILRRFYFDVSGVQIRTTGTAGTADSRIISFDALGRLSQFEQAPFNIGFCDGRAANTADERYIIINATGRPLLTRLDRNIGHLCDPA